MTEEANENKVLILYRTKESLDHTSYEQASNPIITFARDTSPVETGVTFCQFINRNPLSPRWAASP